MYTLILDTGPEVKYGRLQSQNIALVINLSGMEHSGVQHSVNPLNFHAIEPETEVHAQERQPCHNIYYSQGAPSYVPLFVNFASHRIMESIIMKAKAGNHLPTTFDMYLTH